MGKVKVAKFFRSPKPTIGVDGTPPSLLPEQLMQSLGTGSLSPDGSVTFVPSPGKMKRVESGLTVGTCSESESSAPKDVCSHRPEFLRKKSSFLRVADLDMTPTTGPMDHSDNSYPNYHRPAVDPPPGVDHDPKEMWIALNDGSGSHAPIAPLALERLADFGLMASLNANMWSPDSKTQKLLRSTQCQLWMKETFNPGSVAISCGQQDENEVLIWTGNFRHGFYGSELPTIRAAGLVNMSARSLMELMVDSSRVKEYNKFSVGREDIVTFQDNMNTNGPFGRSITKVMKSETRPPMVRKTVAFVSILHAKELADGSGYLIVSRAVHHPEEEGALSSATKSEILMGVNVIRTVKGFEDSHCLMVNVNHIRSPMIPMMLAKRIGLSAAVGFINDIRGLC